jgi:hypothetical protein
MRPKFMNWMATAAVAVLIPFAPAVLGLRTLAHRDADQLYAPVRTLVVEALRGGRLPLWNPYEGLGKPLFAEGIHSVLHPVSLLGAVVAPGSVDFLILGYLVAAAVGALLFTRSLGASAPAAFGASLAFALSGYSVSMTGNLVFLAGLATLPWLLGAAVRAGSGDRWAPLWTALATACVLLSGDVQTAIVGLALGVLLASADGWRGAARTIAGMAVGVFLAGVQVLPSREALLYSFRGVGLQPWEETRWPLTPGRLLEWVIPGLLRGSPASIPMGASGEALPLPFAESVYLGVPLVFAALLAARRGGRRVAFLVGSAAVLVWLALGHHLGAREALGWVPVWNRFRYSEKLMAPLALTLAALAAAGIDAFGAAGLSRRATHALALASVVGAAVFLALLLAPDAAEALAVGAVGSAGSFYRCTLVAGLPHLVVGLLAILAANRGASAAARTATLSLLVALAPASAVYFGAHLGVPDAHRLVTSLRFGSDSPVPRIAHPAERVFYAGDPSDFADERARLWPGILIPAANVAFRVDALAAYGAFRPHRLETVSSAFGTAWPMVARRFAVTHVAVPFPFSPAYRGPTELALLGGSLVQGDPALGFELWAVPHRPWAFFAGRSRSVAGPDAAQRVLHDLEVEGDHDTVIVEGTVPPSLARGRILRVERGTESLRIEAEADGPGLLVVQDAFWPGWRAYIDDQPAEILAADALVRAVRWPGGRHTLEMSYDPPVLRTGLALSAIGAILAVWLAVIAVRRGKVARGHRRLNGHGAGWACAGR